MVRSSDELSEASMRLLASTSAILQLMRTALHQRGNFLNSAKASHNGRLQELISEVGGVAFGNM